MTIARVTESIRDIVAAAVEASAIDATVRAGPPSAIEPGGTEVNICFYRLEPNAMLRNDSIVSRTPDGSIPLQARNAFDLHYLIAFAAEPLAAETMLGNVLTALSANPVLGGEQPIRLVAEYPTLADLARLWRAFQLPIRPSLYYVASPVTP